jgi:hypothetical protein
MHLSVSRRKIHAHRRLTTANLVTLRLGRWDWIFKSSPLDAMSLFLACLEAASPTPTSSISLPCFSRNKNTKQFTVERVGEIMHM